MMPLRIRKISKERRAAATIALFPLPSAEQRFTFAATTKKGSTYSIEGTRKCTTLAVSTTATPVVGDVTSKSHSFITPKICGQQLRPRAREVASRLLLVREWQRLQQLDAERIRNYNKFGCGSCGYLPFSANLLNKPSLVEPAADPFTTSFLGSAAQGSKSLFSAGAAAAVRQVSQQRQKGPQQLLQQSSHNAGHDSIKADDEEWRSRRAAAAVVSDPPILQCTAAAETSAETLRSEHGQQQEQDQLSQARHKLLRVDSNDGNSLDCKTPQSSPAATSFSGSRSSSCGAVKGSSDTENLESSCSSNATVEQLTDGAKTKKWSFGNLILAAAGASIVAAYSWLLVHCDFNIAKTEWLLREFLCRALLRHERGEKRDAQDRSRFEVGFSEELQKEIALYFLQLDLDKPNGVRRSDAISLVEELGYPSASKACKTFLDAGSGRTLDAKRVSGVSLQDFAALLEQLVIEEELSATDGVTAAAASAAAGATTKFAAEPHGESAAADTKEGVSAGAAGAAVAIIPGHAEGDDSLITKRDGQEQMKQQQQKGEADKRGDPRDRLLRYLREANRCTVTAATIPTCYTEREMTNEEKRTFPFSAASIPANLPATNHKQTRQLPEPLSQLQQPKQQQHMQKNEQICVESERQALILQAERLEKTTRDLRALSKRRRLSEAETARLAHIEELLKRVKHDLWCLERYEKAEL